MHQAVQAIQPDREVAEAVALAGICSVLFDASRDQLPLKPRGATAETEELRHPVRFRSPAVEAEAEMEDSSSLCTIPLLATQRTYLVGLAAQVGQHRVERLVRPDRAGTAAPLSRFNSHDVCQIFCEGLQPLRIHVPEGVG